MKFEVVTPTTPKKSLCKKNMKQPKENTKEQEKEKYVQEIRESINIGME